jgi:Uma2 family endonuclease
MEAVEKPHITPSEYLAREERADTKHDFVNGEIVAMTGGSIKHNLIAGNLYMQLRTRLTGSPCQAFIGDVRLAVDKQDLFTYPDLMIVCGDLETYADREDTITNPKLIIEVLSKSTKDYDHGTKAPAYREIETLDELVLVDPYPTHLEHWTRRGDYWEVRIIRNKSNDLVLESVDLTIPLEEVYRDVDFTETG